MSEFIKITDGNLKDVPVETSLMVRTSDGHEFKASRRWTDGFFDEDGNESEGWQWQADGDDYPECWSEGACWGSNVDDNPSDPVVAWRHLP